MKDIDIDNIIESVNSEKKEEMRAQLHARLGMSQNEEPRKKDRKRFFSPKVISFGIAGLCAVCLAIVLPISLHKSASSPSSAKYTYNASDFSDADLGFTIKDYAEQTGKNILYIDWYDIADDYMTTKYFLPNKVNDIIYLSEELYNGETGDHVCLSVVNTNTNVDTLDSIEKACNFHYTYNDTNIGWSYSLSLSTAYFEYDAYKYYILLYDPITEQSILDIVKSMFK
ncbi:MAG: hypothetical protein J1G38_04035 [Clostridiales bacterium]|nr:hypothetical protein [Clostridiales bacterium]